MAHRGDSSSSSAPIRRQEQGVPTSSLFKTVTVRCGHCSSLLTVNIRGLLFPGTPAANTAAAAAPPPAAAITSSITITTETPPATSVNNGQFHFPQSLNLAPNPHHQSLRLDEISSAADPSLQLLEQHGLGGLIPSGRNAAAAPPPWIVQVLLCFVLEINRP